MSLPAFERGTKRVNVVIEAARGCSYKYKYDEQHGVLRLHKLLPRGAVFPFDFGFIPSTLAEDGDPLDVLVLGAEPALPGTVVTARLLGVLRAEQRQNGKRVRNDRLVGVPEGDQIKAGLQQLKQLPAPLLEELEHFFISYNQARSVSFAITGRHGPVAAVRLVAQGMRRYRAKRG
jgi:inorganic pyrophosphatase